MRSVLLASCVFLILICHLADSVSINRVSKFNDVDVAEQLGRKVNVHDRKTTNELIALLEAKISGKHIREGEACPSSEILDLESDAFGLFLYPSNDPDHEDDEGDTTEAEDEDEHHDEEEQNDESAPGEPELTGSESTNVNDDEDEHQEEDGNEYAGRKASRITTKSKRVLKLAHGKELTDEEDLFLSTLFEEGEHHEETEEHESLDENDEEDDEHHEEDDEHDEEDDEHDEEDDEHDEEDDEHDEDAEEHESPDEHDEEDDEQHEDTTKNNKFGKESLKASEYEELIDLVRRNINRGTFVKRSKRSARANDFVRALGVNDARTDAQCSHVIKTTQNVITVIVLADECDNGEVHLYNGEDNSSENPQVVKCGQTDPLVVNADGSVYIEYVYDSSTYHGGFGLLWIGSN